MSSRQLSTPANECLRASPNFSIALTLDGRPYVAKDVEPYVQYWLSERERVLLSMFSGRRGATLQNAIEACIRLRGDDSAAERRRLARAAAGMREAGVLVAADADTSRYDRRIVAAYVTHRPFPAELLQAIVGRAQVGTGTRVLDLAGGPGDLALGLAGYSGQVTLMELSRSFLAAARARAREAGVPLQTAHESCNRLVHDGGRYDLITVSQALHWLDDVMVCRGVCRVLSPQGHFMIVHSAFEVEPTHPLAFVLGHDSILGRKTPVPFAQEVQALHDRVALLLQALDARDVERADVMHETALGAAAGGRLRPAGVSVYRQRRTLGLGFLQALLTDRHLTGAGLDPTAFWADVRQRCAAATPAQLQGTHRWALLHFARQGGDAAWPSVLALPEVDITCAAPGESLAADPAA
jgi:ubiquinone/menaquinone biosynthesis C-methylase UbiE